MFTLHSRYEGDKSLSQAITNVNKHYSIIGICEQFSQFVYALEYLYPTYFKGMTNVNHIIGLFISFY